MDMKQIELLDSTLRDGAQSQGISLSVEDKLKLVRMLDELGVTYIEGGNPASNPKDAAFFTAMLGAELKNSRLVAFGSTCRKDTRPQDDERVTALIDAGTDYVSIFGKSWDMHVTKILETALEENLRMISDTVRYLTERGIHVFFDAEHFFDGMKNNREYALQTIKAAYGAGAELIVLCDTNGGAFLKDIEEGVNAAAEALGEGAKIGIHCHNDCSLAVANSMAAVGAGAMHIQGTLIGIGERCGNTNLTAVIGNLQLKSGYSLIPDESLRRLTEAAYYTAEICNIKLPDFMPYVGGHAFSHKGGMHADGVIKLRRSFEHIDPETVGNRRSFVLSELAGRNALLEKLRVFGISLEKNSIQATRVINRIKELENRGYVFEGAQASFELTVLKELDKFTPFFSIVDYRIIGSQTEGVNAPANAMVKVRVGNRHEITADEGQGPVNAIDRALRKALEVFYPVVSSMSLVDYKVRVIDTGASTAAITRVLIESTDGKDTWTTVGASEDIISASMTALADSIEYMLYKKKVYNYMG